VPADGCLGERARIDAARVDPRVAHLRDWDGTYQSFSGSSSGSLTRHRSLPHHRQPPGTRTGGESWQHGPNMSGVTTRDCPQ
jgi:hypothetical protein